MPTPVKVGSIQGYALTGVSSNMRVGAIQGYALVRTPNLPNFALGSAGALLAALNKQYRTTFLATGITFGAPAVLAGDDAFNTTTQISALRSSGYSGSKTMRYNRVDFANALNGKDTSLPTSGMSTSVVGSLAAINTKYGLILTAADVVDKAIPAGALGVSIVAADTSPLFLPGTVMRIGAQIPTMAAAFPQVEIFAF